MTGKNMQLHRTAAAFSIAIAGLGISIEAYAAQKVVPAQSEIGFVSKQMGVPVQGKFERFDGTINVDPAKPESGKVTFTVDLGSASIGTPDTATELKKPEWFDVAKAANATFQSTSIKAAGPGKIDVVGKLTIKGVSNEIHVPMTLAQQGDTLKASGEFTIKRLDYKIGSGEWGDTGLVANEVLVRPRLTVQGTANP
jgi:polyisoprenoid-binding protein YceI